MLDVSLGAWRFQSFSTAVCASGCGVSGLSVANVVRFCPSSLQTVSQADAVCVANFEGTIVYEEERPFQVTQVTLVPGVCTVCTASGQSLSGILFSGRFSGFSDAIAVQNARSRGRIFGAFSDPFGTRLPIEDADFGGVVWASFGVRFGLVSDAIADRGCRFPGVV